MALAGFAAVAIPASPGLTGITCHQGIWYWAGEEATARGQRPATAHGKHRWHTKRSAE